MAYNYGSDLKLNDSNDLDIVGSDISTVSFQANMQQTLKNLLGAEKGSYPLNRFYGINMSKFVGAKGLRKVLDNLTDELYTALRAEPRVKTIYSLNITPRQGKAGVYDVNITIGLIDKDETINLNLVYPNPRSVIPVTNRVEDEYQETLTSNTLRTQYDIDEVLGVYSVFDTEKENDLYGQGGFVGRDIKLEKPLQTTNAKVVVDYITKNVEYNAVKVKFIDYEYVLPIDVNTVFVPHKIYEMHGVYLHDDEELTNNLYTDGAYYKDQTIYLSEPLETELRNVLVIYTAYAYKETASQF